MGGSLDGWPLIDYFADPVGLSRMTLEVTGSWQSVCMHKAACVLPAQSFGIHWSATMHSIANK